MMPPLADDLATFLRNLSDGCPIRLDNGQEFRLARRGGAIGDVVFLSHSVQETSYDRWGRTQNLRFPGHLRTCLESQGIDVFNP